MSTLAIWFLVGSAGVLLDTLTSNKEEVKDQIEDHARRYPAAIAGLYLGMVLLLSLTGPCIWGFVAWKQLHLWRLRRLHDKILRDLK